MAIAYCVRQALSHLDYQIKALIKTEMLFAFLTQCLFFLSKATILVSKLNSCLVKICKFSCVLGWEHLRRRVHSSHRGLATTHFLKRQNRSKNKIGKITVKSRNEVTSVCFHMIYVISQPFLKLSTWIVLHIFVRHCPLTYCTFFWRFWFKGFLKKQIGHFFWNFSKFWKLEIAVL